MKARNLLPGLAVRTLLLVLLAVVPALLLLAWIGLERRDRSIAEARADAIARTLREALDRKPAPVA